MSLLTGQIITRVLKIHPKLIPYQIAGTLAFLCGSFVFVLGILCLGFIVDFIPLPGLYIIFLFCDGSSYLNCYPIGSLAIGAFMTLSIAIGQVPALMGITGFDTKAKTYFNILKHLGRTQIDAALGALQHSSSFTSFDTFVIDKHVKIPQEPNFTSLLGL